MFNLNDSMRYYLYPYPMDIRKSFYTLSGEIIHLAHNEYFLFHIILVFFLLLLIFLLVRQF